MALLPLVLGLAVSAGRAQGHPHDAVRRGRSRPRGALAALPARRPQATANRPYVMVVVMHDVAPPGSPWARDPLSVTPAHLQQDLQFLSAHRWQTLTPEQLYAYMKGELVLRRPSILLTFDDGLEGIYRYAFPLFLRYRMRFTVFVIASRTRHRHPLSGPGRAYMTWGELRQMRRSGLCSVEAHTYGLHHLDEIRPGVIGPAVYPKYFPLRRRYESAAGYAARLTYDFAVERRLFLANLGYAPQFLAWPFGASTPFALMVARRYGIKAFFTVTPGLAVPGGDVLSIPRIGLSQMDQRLPGLASYWQRAAVLAAPYPG